MKFMKTGLLICALGLGLAAHAQSEPADSNTADFGKIQKDTNNSGGLQYNNSMGLQDAIPTGQLWATSFFSFASATTQQISKGSASVSSYNYLSLNRRLSEDTKFSLRVPFYYNTAGFNKYGDFDKQDVSLSDVHLVYSMYDLGYIGAIDISGNLKLYLPTSDYSQTQRTIAKIRPEMFFEWAFGRFSSLTYVVKPDYYIQSQTAYFDKTTRTRDDGSYVTDPRHTTKIASVEHYLELDADMGRYWSVKPSIGFTEDWYNKSAAENLPGAHLTYARTDLGFEIRPARWINFTVGIENKAPLNRNKYGDKVALFRPKDNTVFLMTNAYLY